MQSVTISGSRDEMLAVTIDLNRLEAYNLTAAELLDALAKNNMVVPGGTLTASAGKAFSAATNVSGPAGVAISYALAGQPDPPVRRVPAPVPASGGVPAAVGIGRGRVRLSRCVGEGARGLTQGSSKGGFEIVVWTSLQRDATLSCQNAVIERNP